MKLLQRLTHSLNRLTHSQLIRLLLNHHFARYGTMTELKIDDERKVIEARLQLKGEEGPIEIRVEGYTLVVEGESGIITIGEIKVSREWMNTVANELLKNKAIPLPPGIGKWAGLVL